MEEWDCDLQAVVRGCRGGSTAAAARDPLSSFSPSILQEQDGFGYQEKEGQGYGGDMFFCFPNLLGSSTECCTEKLVKKLYTPFFPKLSSACLTSSPHPLASPSAVSLLQTGGFTPEKEEKDELNVKIHTLSEELKSRDERINKMDEHLQQLHLEHVSLIKTAEKTQRMHKDLEVQVKDLKAEVEKQRITISDGAEGKREAIRQLCFSLEHYRLGYQELRHVLLSRKRHHFVLAS